MFRRICKLASGTQQRADSPLESLIWYRKRFISCSSSSFCRKWGAPLVSQSKDKDTLLVEEWDFPELWSLHPTCHAVQQKKKKKKCVKKKNEVISMRVICFCDFCDGIIEILFWGLYLLYFNENFTLLQKWFILQTTSLSSFCFSKAWVSSEFMKGGKEKKAEVGWQRRENPQGWEGDGPTGPKDYVDPWPTLRKSSRISRRKYWTGHLGGRA